ncbi:MAG: hypothetical protein M1814_003264 [Vezdaea aestivalis]|nr:MAG: hypothetical protein M1814_003264 [Vezdaea aestivalis]
MVGRDAEPPNSQMEWSQEIFQGQSFRDYLPSWLGGTNSSTRALIPMLKALKDAVEGYTETPLTIAGLVLPIPGFASAFSHLSLRYYNRVFRSAAIYGASIQGLIDDEDEYKPTEMDLVIDFSDAALTATLIAVNAAVPEYLRVLHETSIEAQLLPQKFDHGVDSLTKALEPVVAMPYKDDKYKLPRERLANVVLMGEQANDPRLMKALKQVL